MPEQVTPLVLGSVLICIAIGRVCPSVCLGPRLHSVFYNELVFDLDFYMCIGHDQS